MPESTNTKPYPDDMVTRCPGCSTSFRITPAQLQTAKGAVRCGSCLQIFKALDHLLTPTAETKATDTKATETKAAETKATECKVAETQAEAPKKDGRLEFDQAAIDRETDSGDPDDDLLISDDMELIDDDTPDAEHTGSELGDNFIELHAWKPEPNSLFERSAREPDPDEEESTSTDESWAVSLLAELEQEQQSENGDQAQQTKADKTQKPGEEQHDYSLRATGSFSPASDADIEATLGQPLADGTEPTLGDIGAFHSRETGAEPKPSAETLFNDQQNAPEEQREYLANIEPAPVEMDWAKPSRRWHRQLLWGTLSLIAALVLFAQFAWFKIEYYGRIEPYRSWYITLCPTLGCQVPPIQDRRLIKAYNLVVRSHPRAEKALMVDAILLNTAGFRQPFPELELTFSNLQGQAIAQRRFAPDEYLRGELAGRRLMPIDQPIHLSLELVDPGPDAVNYSATIPVD